MSTPTSDALLTKVDACRWLKVSRATLQRLIGSGLVPVVHIGRSVRIRPSALEAYVAKLEESPAPSGSGPQAGRGWGG